MKSIGSSERRLREGDIVLLDIPNGYRGYHTDKALCFSTVPSKHPQSKLIRAAREQCVFLENEAAAMLLRPGSVPSARYMASCAPALTPRSARAL